MAEKMNVLKIKLSSVMKKKLIKDSDSLKLRSMDCLYSEELSTVKTEIEFTADQLKQLQDQIYQMKHQTSLVKICATSENSKLESLDTDLNKHKRQFDEFFDKVQSMSKLHLKELQQNEDEENAMKRHKANEMEVKNEQLLTKAIAIENECENIEVECNVLKKRNNAIMLKLRRKLVETENFRKQFKKRTAI